MKIPQQSLDLLFEKRLEEMLFDLMRWFKVARPALAQYPDEAVMRDLRKASGLIRAMGATSLTLISLCVTFMVLIEPDFEPKFPAIRSIIGSNHLPEDDKITWMISFLNSFKELDQTPAIEDVLGRKLAP
jgi:hypothetical protein